MGWESIPRFVRNTSKASSGLHRSFFLAQSCLEQIIFMLRLKGVTCGQCLAPRLEYSWSSWRQLPSTCLSPQNEVLSHADGCAESHSARQIARDGHGPELSMDPGIINTRLFLSWNQQDLLWRVNSLDLRVPCYYPVKLGGRLTWDVLSEALMGILHHY